MYLLQILSNIKNLFSMYLHLVKRKEKKEMPSSLIQTFDLFIC